MKVHLGCGLKIMPGWINVDIANFEADIIEDCILLNSIKDGIVDKIYCSHLIEHFNHSEIITALSNWYRILKPEGELIIRCPNMVFWMNKWLDMPDEVKYCSVVDRSFFGPDTGPMAHKRLFSKGLLKIYLEKANFKVLEIKCVSSRSVELDKQLLAGKEDRGENTSSSMSDIWCRANK